MELPPWLVRKVARWGALLLLWLGTGLAAFGQGHFTPATRGKSAAPAEAPGLTPDPAKLFAAGEQLSYTIYWGPFEVGHADWFVWPARNSSGENILRSILNVRTNGATDLIYRIRANSSTWAAPDLGHSLQYTTQQDDSNRLRNAQLTFDTKHLLVNEKMSVTAPDGTTPAPPHPPPGAPEPAGNFTAAADHPNRGGFAPVPPSPWPVKGPAYDPLAALVYYRTLPLADKMSQHTCVCDTRGVHDVTVRVLGLETVSLPTGPVYAWVIEPDLPGAGLFMRGANKPMRLWIAADGTRRPLRFTGSIGVGTFEADLVSTAPFSPPSLAEKPVATKDSPTAARTD